MSFTLFLAFCLVLLPSRSHADDAAKSDDVSDKTAKRSLYVVETDSSSAMDSLNRVAGPDIDLGFSTKEQSYKTEKRDKINPFSKEDTSY